MSWIKDNKFLVGLGAITFVLALILYMYGSSGASRFKDAQEAYQTASTEAASFEKGKLYPNGENVNGKRVALEEYAESVDTLQGVFGSYRPEAAPALSPQEFSDALKAANEETRAAFGEKALIPESYYTGFENYTNRLAPGKATEVLSFQLEGVKSLMLGLAETGITQLINVHRPALEEESGKKFEPKKDQVARGLPIEISFVASEESVNRFLSKIANADQELGGHYVVIRSMRILNSKRLPPKLSDVEFERPEIKKGDPGLPGGFFDEAPEAPASLFDTDVEETPPAEGAAGDAPAPVALPQPAPVNDTSRNLAQVLGNEDLQVFLRLDLMKVLPAKKLP